MIKQTEHFVLDYIKIKDDYNHDYTLSITDGLEISLLDETKIARITWVVNEQSCHIVTYGTNLQDCIITWDLFKEFIELVDEAYYKVSLAIECQKLDKFMD